MAKHTPGPWELDGVEVYPVNGHRACDAICELSAGQSDDLFEANARLIAAAPELLEALERLLEAYSSQMRSDYDYPGDPWTAEGRHDDDALQAICTIAKAKGEQL